MACVRETRTVDRLHETWVASRPLPEASNITSGVNPTHQFGGSTFVTSTVDEGELCCGGVLRAALLQLNRKASAKKILR